MSAAAVWARAGGGHTYGGGESSERSGSSGGSHGSGSGGDDDLIFFLIRLLLELLFEVPQVGVPILVVLMVVAVYMAHRDRPREWGAQVAPVPRWTHARARELEARLEALRREDPSFSRPVFLDFVGLLYARAVRARGTGEVAPVEPYLAPELARAWQSGPTGARAVEEVVVGAVRIHELSGLAARVSCEVLIEASFREVWAEGGAGHGVWSRESWVFERAAGVLSKGPDEAAKLGCPSCGAPCELKPGGACTYCDRVVTRGDFAWQVASVRVLERRERPPEDELVRGGQEAGTDAPTRVQPMFDVERRRFKGRHPEFDLAAFERMARETFFAIQEAWTSGTWEAARPFETHHLFDTHRYWLETYRAAGLRNVLEQVRIDRVEFARFEQDAFYESITVRIRACMLDYTVDPAGTVKSGDKSRPRRASEYWTFIAAVGAPVTRGPSAASCPSCGARVSVAQTGRCAHCDALVTTGKFGWVLSRIEQDESYAG